MILDAGFPGTAVKSASDLFLDIGPTITVEVGFDEKFNYNAAGATLPAARGKAVPALIDTGATLSSIDDQLALELKLPLIIP